MTDEISAPAVCLLPPPRTLSPFGVNSAPALQAAVVDTLGEELDTVLLLDDQSVAGAMLGSEGFLRIKLLRADLPDDLQPDDRPLETQCAVNVKERVDINGNSIDSASTISQYSP